MDRLLDLEERLLDWRCERLLEAILEELLELTLDLLLEELLELLLSLFDLLPMGSTSTILLLRREEELLELELRERELLELEEVAVLFRPGIRIVLSFISTFLSSRSSSSSLRLITLIIFSAALSPT